MAGLAAYPSFRQVQLVTQTTTLLAPQTIDDLLIGLRSGVQYSIRAGLLFRSNGLTNGIALGLTCPAFSELAAHVRIPNGADGVAASFDGEITSSGDEVVSTAVQATVTTYFATLEGMIEPSAAGNLQLTFRSENNGTTVALRAGSWLEVSQLTL